MLTSKERAELRAQANGLETTLIVGKGGVTEQVVLEAVTQLEARELIKGRALEASFLTAREALDALCAATGAEPVCAVGFRFVLYRESERLKRERNQVGRSWPPSPWPSPIPCAREPGPAARRLRPSGSGATLTSARRPSTGPLSGRRKRQWDGRKSRNRKS